MKLYPFTRLSKSDQTPAYVTYEDNQDIPVSAFLLELGDYDEYFAITQIQVNNGYQPVVMLGKPKLECPTLRDFRTSLAEEIGSTTGEISADGQEAVIVAPAGKYYDKLRLISRLYADGSTGSDLFILNQDWEGLGTLYTTLDPNKIRISDIRGNYDLDNQPSCWIVVIKYASDKYRVIRGWREEQPLLQNSNMFVIHIKDYTSSPTLQSLGITDNDVINEDGGVIGGNGVGGYYNAYQKTLEYDLTNIITTVKEIANTVGDSTNYYVTR